MGESVLHQIKLLVYELRFDENNERYETYARIHQSSFPSLRLNRPLIIFCGMHS
jgi:hypothetical protein